VDVEGGTAECGNIVALTDLISIHAAIEAYAQAYLQWLGSDDPEALKIDVARVELPGIPEVLAMAPTHPLRLLWSLQEQQLAHRWLEDALGREQVSGDLVDTWRTSFAPTGIPPLLVTNATDAFVDAGPIPGGWGLYLPLRARDSRALLALVHARLGTGRMHTVEADIRPALLADKLELLLRQHAYTPALVVNVINPGDGALVVDSLLELEERRRKLPPLRYEVRLFADRDLPEIGAAFRELADPERQVSDVAAQLVAPGRSFLFPRLSWSRRPVQDFLDSPDDFMAHATLMLDPFSLSLRVARRDSRERSSYVHGLVQEAPRRFVGRGGAYAWVRRPAPRSCEELTDAPGRSGLLARLITATGSLQASVIAPGSDTTGSTAAAALDLRPGDQSLIFSAHSVSTWVLTVDPYLGLDYFDAKGSRDRRGYLLDFTPEFVAAGGRQLLLTTRAGEEIERLMAPAVQELELSEEPRAAELLVEALRSLSGRLALRLLSSPSQVQGALGMALSRLVLEAYGVLEQAVIVPLDAHPELTRERPTTPNLRGDLLIVTADPDRQTLDFLVVEAKCLQGGGLPESLRSEIVGQVRSSEEALREAFDRELRVPDRIDRIVQSWRLTTVLDFYLERARRYGLVEDDVGDELRGFFQDLESGYTLSVRKMGLVFRLDTAVSAREPDTTDPDVPIWVLGRDVFLQATRAALRSYDVAPGEDQGGEGSTLRDHPTWDTVRAGFIRYGRAPRQGQSVASTPSEPSAVEGEDRAQKSDKAVTPPDERAAEEHVVDGGEEIPPGEIEADVFIGSVHATPQFGVFASPTNEPDRKIALDLDGCNTFSIFGVQGSGKSYTVGTVVESAVTALPGLNRLPHPLAAVVFHYHQTQDYPPEFVAMGRPNDDEAEVRSLQAWGGTPTAVPSVVVLTTRDMLDRRREEFSGVAVEPISFASTELTAQDWRFLMGATTSDSFYLQLLNDVMRRARDDLTLDAIRQGIDASPMSNSQRNLATTRLDFAARFIDDRTRLRSLIQPGRVLIVDVRDEFIDKEQALGLFVAMLNVFSGAGMSDEPFNKLIVFDEAHKYMSGGPLINQVVEVIREMRHKGVSIVVASQDPVNVPAPVIELSSIVALHKFNSPGWLKHIQRSVAALGELTSQMMQALAPGEAYLWASKASDPVFTRRAVRVNIRPRASKHGGSTRRASDQA
jgi:DNA helicase HerA-like ATPase